MANSVRRCSSQERRLWTCSRSKRGTPQNRREASIWSGPRAPEAIQTLSAENKLGGPLSLARPYPITFWDEPYMGEESIRRPPESKKAPITCAQASRAIGSFPAAAAIIPRSPRVLLTAATRPGATSDIGGPAHAPNFSGRRPDEFGLIKVRSTQAHS